MEKPRKCIAQQTWLNMDTMILAPSVGTGETNRASLLACGREHKARASFSCLYGAWDLGSVFSSVTVVGESVPEDRYAGGLVYLAGAPLASK